MTLAAAIPIVRYDGNGVATSFAFNFQFEADDEIVAIHTDTSGNDNTLVLDTDYTVAGEGTAAGTITFPAGGSSYSTLATNEQLTLYRSTELSQLIDYINTTLLLSTLEASFDNVMQILQELQEQLNRAVLQDPSTATAVPSSDAILAAAAAIIANGIYGSVVVERTIVGGSTALTVADDLGEQFIVPEELNGFQLTAYKTAVGTASTSGLPSFQIHNVTQAVDMLSVNSTIDANEKTSYTATTAETVDPANNTVATGDFIRFDCDAAGTSTTGYTVIMTFTKSS